MKRSLLILAVFILAVSVSAEVVIKSKTTVDLGQVGQMNVDGTAYFADDRMLDVEKSKMSGMMGMNLDEEDYTIIRLDKGVQWEYSAGEDIYNERTLGMTDFDGEYAAQKKMSSEGYKWETIAKKELDPITVAGIKCQGMSIQSRGISTDDPEDTVFINYKYYYGTGFDGAETIKSFQKTMKEKTGLGANAMMTMGDETSDEFMFAPVFEMAEDLDNVDGYPMRIEMIAAMSKNPMGGMSEEMDEETLAMMEQMGMQMPSYPKDSDGHFIFVDMVNEVKSIKVESVDAGKFEVPSGLTRITDESEE